MGQHYMDLDNLAMRCTIKRLPNGFKMQFESRDDLDYYLLLDWGGKRNFFRELFHRQEIEDFTERVVNTHGMFIDFDITMMGDLD